MKLKIIALIAILLPFCANAVTLSAGYEYKDLKNEYKLRKSGIVMKTMISGGFSLIDLYAGLDKEIGSEGTYLGLGYKTDVSADVKLKSNNYTADDIDFTREEDGGYDELYIVFGSEFSENVSGELKFNYSKFEKDYSPSVVDSDGAFKYENSNYALEGKMNYKVVSEAYTFGLGAGVILETGDNKEYYRYVSDVDSAKFDYWNLGCLFDVFGAYAFTPSWIGKLGYQFKYSRDLSVSGEKYSGSGGISAGSNQRIDNSFFVNLAYKF